jgi:hypothetical protein
VAASLYPSQGIGCQPGSQGGCSHAAGMWALVLGTVIINGKPVRLRCCDEAISDEAEAPNSVNRCSGGSRCSWVDLLGPGVTSRWISGSNAVISAGGNQKTYFLKSARWCGQSDEGGPYQQED